MKLFVRRLNNKILCLNINIANNSFLSKFESMKDISRDFYSSLLCAKTFSWKKGIGYNPRP